MRTRGENQNRTGLEHATCTDFKSGTHSATLPPRMPESMARLVQLCTLHCGVPICLCYQNRKDERKRTRNIKRKRRYLK